MGSFSSKPVRGLLLAEAVTGTLDVAFEFRQPTDEPHGR